MDTYSLLREIADSWVLLVLTLIFLGVIVWAFRPGSARMHRDVAQSIFRNEDKPARDDTSDSARAADAGMKEAR